MFRCRHLLKYGLAIVLVFVGGKMLAMPWFHVPIQWSLSIVASILLVSVAASLTLSNPARTPPRQRRLLLANPKGD